MRHDLIGFVVGALDAPEHDEIRQRLQDDSELQRQMQLVERGLKPLAVDRQSFSPPPGLATRTCEHVAGVRDHGDSQAKHGGSVPKLTPASRREGPAEQRRWAIADFVVAAGVCLAAACLFIPAVLNSQYHSQLNFCQKRMQNIGQALNSYSMQDSRSRFPVIPAKGNLAVAGSYAPTLVSHGLVKDSTDFFCPAKNETIVVRIPSRTQVLAAKGPQLVTFKQTMGGDFAYTLGFLRNGKLQGVRNRGRKHFPVLADEPKDTTLPKFVITSHGRGQNVLFEDGHVKFCSLRVRPGDPTDPGDADDDMFVNQAGAVQAGLHDNDAVLAPSSVSPTGAGVRTMSGNRPRKPRK